MTLADQVTSLEISKQLRKLGVKQDSLFVWKRQNQIGVPQPFYKIVLWEERISSYQGEWFSAFTVAELGELLRKSYQQLPIPYRAKSSTMWEVIPLREIDDYIFKTEAEARGKMLIYLLENKLI